MLTQRIAQQSLRRLATSQHGLASKSTVFQKFAKPAVIMGSSSQTRPVATESMKPADSYQILVAQRKNRPSSPHLTIYQPQVPWVLSITHRLTGSILSGGFYIFGSAYLVAPLFGWHLDSASMAAAFAAWPVALKIAAKAALAFPFTFHSFNGIRHFSWDMGKTFNNLTVVRTGWACVGVSAVSALALVAFV